MRILLLGILTILPGSWITFGLPLREFNWKARLALGVAFSPVVLAIELGGLRAIGLDFARAARMILVANLPAVILLMRRLPRLRALRPSIACVFASLLFVIVAGSAVAPWLLVPRYRPFSWHALLHTDVIYALTRNGLVPEEPELAGLVLAYDWVGAVYWSTLGWLSDWSPTSMYPVTNLIWLLVAFVLAYEVAHTGLGLRHSTALFGVGLMFFGTQVVGCLAWLVAQDAHRWFWALGDVRNTAMVMSFQGFEDKPFAIALILGLALVCSVGMRQRVAYLGVLVPALMISVAVIYPILFPMACLLSGGMVVGLASGWAQESADYKRRELLVLVGGWVISVAVFLMFLAVVSTDRTIASIRFLHSGRWSRSYQITTSLFAYLICAAPFVVRSLVSRSGPALAFALTGSCLMALYVFCGLNDLESKLINAAAIPFAFLAAGGLEPLLDTLPRGRWALVLLVPLALATVHLLHAYHLGAAVPSNLTNAPRISEGSFWIALSSTEEDAAWTKAVRESAPSETVVVARKTGIHLAPFLARSLYFPSDYDDASLTGYRMSPAGYSVDKRHTLLGQRGYSQATWDERLTVTEELYGPADAATMTVVLQRLQALGRPLAIYFPSDRAPALAWLRREQIGTQLFSDGTNVVWIIERPRT